MGSKVFFLPLPEENPQQQGLEIPLDLKDGLTALVRALGRSQNTTMSGTLGLKTSFGKPRRPGALSPSWHKTIAEALAPGKSWGVFDTLSITTKGLDKPLSFQETATQKGFPDCVVADDPVHGAGFSGVLPEDSLLPSVTCASGLKNYGSLGVLNPVRPHPHLGFFGMIPSLGLGLVDRQTKLALHEDVRPSVDTPLCAGCGSCLDVCIFDAIIFNGGRAAIDHNLCTGCGECMDACFMAGIAPNSPSQVVSFQEKVADAAAAVVATQAGPVAYFNFLVRLDRSSGGGGRRKRLGNLGVLASFDPVALDQAIWDLIISRSGEELPLWSGFSQDPDAVLARAEKLGLGSRQYDLTEVVPKK